MITTTKNFVHKETHKVWLVDTSVWIDFLKGNETKQVVYLERILKSGETVYLTPVIYQEILQGAESDKRFKQFKEYFGSQPFVQPLDPVESHVEAARLYFRCRKKGVTIRSTIDCFIAQIAIENEFMLLHSDKDFELMESVISKLKVVSFENKAS